jgi:hypothetical protein
MPVGWPRSTGALGRQDDVTDELTRRLAEQILRGVKELHEEHNPGEPLSPGTPVAPHAVAERIGISPVGRWYAATLRYLEEEGALELNVHTVHTGNAVGGARYVLGERAPELLEDR